jgi:hypothetical protein
MKKNYSTPEIMLVALCSNDIVCTSDPDSMKFNSSEAGGVNAKQRNNIWDE